MSSGSHSQLQSDDMKDPETFRRVLNDMLLVMQQRIDAMEGAPGLRILPLITFETGASVTPTDAPFSIASGGLRVSCPFTPTGLVLLRLQRVRPAGQPVPTVQSDVKWHYAAGAGSSAGDGRLHIDFVTGLDASARYEMLVGVTRGK